MDNTIQTNSLGHKYLRLEIPNYNHHEDSATHPLTYLQLGAPPYGGDPQSPKSQGDDLLDLADVSKPDSEGNYFKDDFRSKNGQTHPDTVYSRDDGVVLSTSDAQTLSKELRTRGGWRLHTDGNYISTTRGDRIDVIYGNYKMVVFGRMDVDEKNPKEWGETYWESSGGHTRWATNTQGDMVMVRWNADRERWQTYQETIKGNSIERYQGIVEEIYECPLMITRVGSADADGSTEIPKSSATKAHTQTDQADNWLNTSEPPRKKERPNITEQVKAMTITETTKVASSLGSATDGPDAGTIKTDTTITKSRSESTMALVTMSETTCDGGVTIDTQTGFRAELGADNAIVSEDTNQRIADYQDISLAVNKMSIDQYTTRKKKGYSNWTFDLNLVGASIDISMFGEEITMPDFKSSSGPNRLEVGITAASSTDISIVGMSTSINANLRLKLEVTEGVSVDIPSEIKTTLIETKTQGSDTEMKAAATETTAFKNSARANTTET